MMTACLMMNLNQADNKSVTQDPHHADSRGQCKERMHLTVRQEVKLIEILKH